MGRRILYIHGIAEIGGAERDLVAMVTMMNPTEWEPHVVCPSQGPLQEILDKAGISVHSLRLPPWRKWYSPFMRWQGVKGLRRLLQQLRPELIHVNDFWWVPHAIEARSHDSVGRIPIVAHVRQEIEPEKARRYRLGQVEAVITMSNQIEEAVIAGGVTRQRVQTIYSGLDLSRAVTQDGDRTAIYEKLGLSKDVVLLGTVASLFPRKGYDVMLRALPAIIRAEPSTHYLIIGTGEAEYERTLRALSEKLGIAQRVHFVGFQDSVRSLLAALDLYVHPARMEGFGIAVVEAMAAGKAVVATKTGGLSEVVAEGQTGLLVASDNPEELGDAVVALLRDKGRREAMGMSGVSRVRERFDLRGSVASFARTYRRVLAVKQE